jgi:hypothetical protein
MKTMTTMTAVIMPVMRGSHCFARQKLWFHEDHDDHDGKSSAPRARAQAEHDAQPAGRFGSRWMRNARRCESTFVSGTGRTYGVCVYTSPLF